MSGADFCSSFSVPLVDMAVCIEVDRRISAPALGAPLVRRHQIAVHRTMRASVTREVVTSPTCKSALRPASTDGDPRRLPSLDDQSTLLVQCVRECSRDDAPSQQVLAEDFADPFVLQDAGVYYAYSTGGPRGIVQVACSTDLTHWTWSGAALAAVPQWATGRAIWAPSVVRLGDQFVMHFAARDRATGQWCLSVAVAPHPNAVFVDTSTAPFLCQTDRGGSIDPYAFVDRDGTPYLLWKSQSATGAPPSVLFGARLTADGTAIVASSARVLLTTANAWEGDIIENPAMVVGSEGYTLLYSGNSYETDRYAVGVARCAGPLGPCTAHVGERGAELVRHNVGAGWRGADHGSRRCALRHVPRLGFSTRRLSSRRRPKPLPASARVPRRCFELTERAALFHVRATRTVECTSTGGTRSDRFLRVANWGSVRAAVPLGSEARRGRQAQLPRTPQRHRQRRSPKRTPTSLRGPTSHPTRKCAACCSRSRHAKASTA